MPIKPHRSLQAGGSGGGDGGGGEGGGDGEVCAAAELRRIKTARKNIRVSACMDIFGWRLRAILFCALLGTCVGDIPRRCRAWLQLDWCICFRANGLQAWPLFGVPTAQLWRRALDTAPSSQRGKHATVAQVVHVHWLFACGKLLAVGKLQRSELDFDLVVGLLSRCISTALCWSALSSCSQRTRCSPRRAYPSP